MNALSLKEKRKKQIIGLSVALLIGGVFYIVFSQGDSNKKTTEKTVPTIQIVKEEATLEEGFKSRFSSDLITLKEQVDNLNKKTAGMEAENKNLKAELKNANDILMSDMQLPLPPPETPEGNGMKNRVPPAPGMNKPIAGGYNSTPVQGSQPAVTVMSGLIAKGEAIGKLDKPKDDAKKALQKAKNDLVIPAGSFVRSSLLSGVIAPTMGQGANQPVPVLIRITDLTVLPNFFKADIKNCFLLAETKGSLATETVNFRLKNLACKRNDGSTIERSVDGYVTGENGVEGLSGRVVSKQGALIARAFAAEFLGGIASAFEQAGNIVTTTGSGVVTTIDPNKTLQTGLFSGAAGAFSRVSEFYMDLADNMVPVIEINAGRMVDVVFIKSVNLSRDEAGGE